MQRPIGVTITAILMVVNIFVDVLLSLLSSSPVAPSTGPHGPTFSSFVIVLHIALVVLVAGQCVVVLYYWLGRSCPLAGARRLYFLPRGPQRSRVAMASAP